jgi:hypothetical protein
MTRVVDAGCGAGRAVREEASAFGAEEALPGARELALTLATDFVRTEGEPVGPPGSEREQP